MIRDPTFHFSQNVHRRSIDGSNEALMFDLSYRKIEIAEFGEFYRTRDNSRHDTENCTRIEVLSYFER